MKKVLVIGCPGSGKSTFSKALHDKTHLPLYHLDLLYWNADRTHVSRPVFLERLSPLLLQDAWIIDGNYAHTLPMRLEACDTVFFLDYPTDVCLEGLAARLGTPRTDLPWVETEEDLDLRSFVETYRTATRPETLALLARHPEKTLWHFCTRTDADAFLKTL